MTLPQHVGIAGGGIGACAIAILLAQQGIRSDIYELREEDAKLGGGLSLAPNALRVLDQLGLLEQIKEAGSAFEDMQLVTESGWWLGALKNGSESKYGYPAVRILRSALVNTLHAKVKTFGTLIKVHWNTKVIDVSQTADSASLSFVDGSTVSFDIVVGADGIHSTVRRSLWKDKTPPLHFEGACTVGGFVETGRFKDFPLPAMVYGQYGTLGLMRLPDRDSYFVALEPGQDLGREGWTEWHESGKSIELLQKQMKGWPEPFKSCFEEATPDNTYLWAQHELGTLPAWHKDRVILIGDAAHALPPSATSLTLLQDASNRSTGGQGSAMSLEDAFLLSRCFIEGKSLAAWEKERQRRVAAIRRITRISGNSRRVGGGSYLAFTIKTFSLWAYFRSGILAKEASDIYSYDGSKATLD